MEAFRIGLATIRYLNPAVWIVELGELHENVVLDDVLAQIQNVLSNANCSYVILPIRNLTPAWSGYPIKRPRTFLLGWRSDLGPVDALTAPVKTLIEHPLQVDMSYKGFLQIAHPFDWAAVGDCLTGPMSYTVSVSGCRRSCHPMVTCPMHPCGCRACGEDGLRRAWRKLFLRMIGQEGLSLTVSRATTTLSYVQALEAQGGIAPTTQRARVLLNIIASLPRRQPLKDSAMCADLSQNPPFGTYAVDGMAPTLTTTSDLWCLSSGRRLERWELAALMGLTAETLRLNGQSEAWFRKRLGLTVHVPNFGLALTALMAAPIASCV